MAPSQPSIIEDKYKRRPVRNETPERPSDKAGYNGSGHQVYDYSNVRIDKQNKESVAASTAPPRYPRLRPPHGPQETQEQECTKRPNEELALLLHRIERESDPSRRANVCGALKLISAKPTFRRVLASSSGVIRIIVVVLRETREALVYRKVISRFALESYLSTRSRVLSVLLNVVREREHRVAIFNSSGLVSELVEIIQNDKEDDRDKVLSCFSYFAKSAGNRVALVRKDGFLDFVKKIISTNAEASEEPVEQDHHKDDDDYVADDDGSCGSRKSATKRRYYEDDDSINTHDSLDEYATNDDTGVFLESDVCGKRESPPKKQTFNKYDAEISFYNDDDELGDEVEVLAVEKGHPYDFPRDQYLGHARMHSFAILVHFSKERQNAEYLAKDEELISTLVQVATEFECRAHLWCLIILANLTRLPSNASLMVSRNGSFIPALTQAICCEDAETRKFATFAIQNLSLDTSLRDEIADSSALLKALCKTVLRGEASVQNGESLAAIATLKNIVDDSSIILKLLNYPFFLKSLTVVAMRAEGIVTKEMQFMACDALSTFSHWLNRVASTPLLKDDKYSKTVMPTHQKTGWEQWEEE